MYWVFDWLDLKMLESFVSVLPSDCFHCLGGPGFSKRTITAVATCSHWLPSFRQCFRSFNSYHNLLSCYFMTIFQVWTLLTWLVNKQQNSRTNPFRKQWHLLEMKVEGKAKTLFPKHSILSQRGSNVAFSSPVAKFFAWNTLGPWPPLGDQNASILWAGLSYGSPSN